MEQQTDREENKTEDSMSMEHQSTLPRYVKAVRGNRTETLFQELVAVMSRVSLYVFRGGMTGFIL